MEFYTFRGNPDNSSSDHCGRAGLAVECRTPNQEDPSLISHWGLTLNKTQ